ncbi:MAG: hypothetical protein IPJ04_13795 [Candidatus Eisenbacteria bacterium]|nr:hypothetical protein [Candidatus Eisenbacteria bacterium]
MPFLLVGLLLPLWFTAPADSLGYDRSGHAVMSASPVHAYLFHRLAADGVMTAVGGYADSLGLAVLSPHAPGTRERVWLPPGDRGAAVTIYVMSRDAAGNVSAPSNGCRLGLAPAVMLASTRSGVITMLPVPILKQSRERCGQAALTMVLRYYGAPPSAYGPVDAAYDPVLKGSLITELANAATRAGYDASVATLTPDLLVELLRAGVPPIVLYQSGRGPLTRPHYGVVTAWDSARGSFTLHDGTSTPYVTDSADLTKRWATAASQALVVRQRQP